MGDLFDYTPTPKDVSDWWKWVLFGFVALLLLSFALWGFGWANAPLRTTSAQNVERLSEEANNRYQGLEAQFSSIGATRMQIQQYTALYGEDPAQWPQGKREEYQQLQNQLSNDIRAYNAACGQYNAMWQDEWRDLPAPDDLPRQCDFIN